VKQHVERAKLYGSLNKVGNTWYGQEKSLITYKHVHTNTQFSLVSLARKINPLGNSASRSKYNIKNLSLANEALRLQDFLQRTYAVVLLIVCLAALCEVATGEVNSTHFFSV
jgi:hypothetical protein